MKRATLLVVACVAVVVASAGQVQAGVIHSPDVSIGGNPFRTFTDDTTGLVWLDLDNFWDGTSTYNSIVTLLSGSGFHLATLPELQILFDSIPAIPANFASEVTIVGGNYVGNPNPMLSGTRNLMWGIFEDGNPLDGVGYAYKYDFTSGWNSPENVIGSNQLLTIFGNENDLGAWVVSDSAVPEPTSLAIFGIGASLLGLGAARRRRREKNLSIAA